MEKDSMMLAIVAIVAVIGIVVMVNPSGLNLSGSVVSEEEYDAGSYGCYVQRSPGNCWELGDDWEEDPNNPGWCRNCGYTGN